MPRHRPRALPDADALRAALAEAGVADAPEGTTEAAQGLLHLAAHVAERLKRVAFPAFGWDDPRFVAEDDKARVEAAFATTDATDAAGWRAFLQAQAPRLRGDVRMLAIDARASGLPEFEIGHILYGRVTLYAWPHKPSESADTRVHDAADEGWSPTLKAHNLLPGRGIVVHDEDQGLVLTEPAAARAHAFLVLDASGDVHLWWNPFADGADAELQYWAQWAGGTHPSEWREILRYEGDGTS